METTRPAASWRDYGWIVLGALIVGWSLVNLAQDVQRALSGASPLWQLLLAAIFWLAVMFFVGAGSWQRTVWGCPFSHSPDGNGVPPCPRHDVERDRP